MQREEITHNGLVYYRYPDSPRRTDRVYYRRGAGRCGYRRLHVLVQRDGIALNHKKLCRRYGEERLQKLFAA